MVGEAGSGNLVLCQDRTRLERLLELNVDALMRERETQRAREVM